MRLESISTYILLWLDDPLRHRVSFHLYYLSSFCRVSAGIVGQIVL